MEVFDLTTLSFDKYYKTECGEKSVKVVLME
jgi:hypothetical protein